MNKPKLYQYAACPFCSKVSSLLGYKKIAFDAVEVHPLKKKEIAFSADYRAVPIYIDHEGVQVNDSTLIMRHIDREFPGNPVFDGSAAETKWLAWSEEYVQGMPTVVYKDLPSSLKSFSYITKVGKFGWLDRRIVQFSGALVMTLVAKKIRKRQGIVDPPAFLRGRVTEWADGLKGSPFMGGEKPNAADMAVYGISRVVAGLEAGKIFSENAAFSMWLNRMSVTTSTPIKIV
jgi:microsomal prostaglandin-E synthase 2